VSKIRIPAREVKAGDTIEYAGHDYFVTEHSHRTSATSGSVKMELFSRETERYREVIIDDDEMLLAERPAPRFQLDSTGMASGGYNLVDTDGGKRRIMGRIDDYADAEHTVRALNATV
jgi:hypothetical protein